MGGRPGRYPLRRPAARRHGGHDRDQVRPAARQTGGTAVWRSHWRPKAIDQQVKKQIAEQEAQLKAFCEQARTNLAQLQNNPRVREDVEGEMRRLTEEERRQRIDETRKQIEENCQ